MTIEVGLNIVTLVMCIITLTMATAALMPQIKLGLVILRDGVLWALLLGIVGFVGVVGWTRLHEARQRVATEQGYGASELQVPDIPVPDLKPANQAPDPRIPDRRVPEFRTPAYMPRRARVPNQTTRFASSKEPESLWSELPSADRPTKGWKSGSSPRLRLNQSPRRVQSSSW